MTTRIAHFLNFNLQCLKAARRPPAIVLYVVAIKHRHIIMRLKGWMNVRRWFVQSIKPFYKTDPPVSLVFQEH